MYYYLMMTQKPTETNWFAGALTMIPEYVADEKTLNYMSYRGLRYRVDRYDVNKELIDSTIYEPSNARAKAWEKYITEA